MAKLVENCNVRVVRQICSSSASDDWDVNRRTLHIGDTGTLLMILHAPNLPDRYIVESDGGEGHVLWLNDFLADEIEPIDPANLN